MAEAVRLLSSTGALKPESERAIRAWFAELLDWLRHSPQGKKASSAPNNIGFWYDLQCAAYAHFCGQPELAEKVLFEQVMPRLHEQISADGSLPQELGRAYPMDYIAFTIAAMALISRAGEHSGVRLWSHQEADGRNFQVAHDWLIKVGSSSQILANLARSIRQSHFDGLWAHAIGRVDGGSFRDLWNALRVDGKGSRGTCRRGHGPRVVIAPVMAMSMAS